MGSPRRLTYRACFVVAIVAMIMFRLSTSATAGQPRLRDLDDRLVDPFQVAARTRAIVFLFLSVDCPYSSRYVPEIQRLYDTFARKNVSFSLIYPNGESSDQIRKQLNVFAHDMRILRDPAQELVRLTKATITPEATVFDRRRTLVYRGRIDDRYVKLGLERPAPTTHDLEEALVATLAGRPVTRATTQAVGCFVADFLR